jgi:polyhydroxyalkanoate synthesis repressor PhaR
MATPRIIKKYPNRRLYDTETSTYITLAEVKDLVLQYREFQVQDAKSGQDLTRAILLQIILEEESGGVPMFSTDMLANIIRYYGHSMQGLMGSYLERSIHAFHEAQKRFQEQAQVLIPKVPAETFTNILAKGNPIPQVMGGYLEQGAKAVIDMQDELRNQALKLFSGFPYAAAGSEAPAEAKPEKPKRARRAPARKTRAKK